MPTNEALIQSENTRVADFSFSGLIKSIQEATTNIIGAVRQPSDTVRQPVTPVTTAAGFAVSGTVLLLLIAGIALFWFFRRK